MIDGDRPEEARGLLIFETWAACNGKEETEEEGSDEVNSKKALFRGRREPLSNREKW